MAGLIKKEKMKVICITLLCLLVLSMIPQSTVTAEEVYAVESKTEFESALAESSSGDTIKINGTIDLGTTATINKGLSIVEGSNAKINGRLLIMTTEQVTIDGVDVEFTSDGFNGDRGVVVTNVNNANLKIKNSTITQNSVSDAVLLGTLTGGTNNVTLSMENVDVYANSTGGQPQAVAIKSNNSNIIMSGCNVQSQYWGVILQGTGNAMTISDSDIFSTGGHAVRASGTGSTVTISDSTITGYANVSSNTANTTFTISNSKLIGNKRDGYTYGMITFEEAASNSNATITGTTFKMNDLSGGTGERYGIQNRALGNTVTMTDSRMYIGDDRSTKLDLGIMTTVPFADLSIDNNYWGENVDNLNDVVVIRLADGSFQPLLVEDYSVYMSETLADLTILYFFEEPEPVSLNGIDTDTTFNLESPQAAGTDITATVHVSGTPDKDGTVMVNLTSADNSENIEPKNLKSALLKDADISGAAQFLKVTAGDPIDEDFEFVIDMPAEDMENLQVVLDFGDNLVTFEDWDNTVLKNQLVDDGGDATAPAQPTREGYNFVKWDKSFVNVSEDMVVKAEYELVKDTKNGDGTDNNSGNNNDGSDSDNGNNTDSKDKSAAKGTSGKTSDPFLNDNYITLMLMSILLLIGIGIMRRKSND